MIHRVVNGLNWVSEYVPTGTVTSAPTAINATALRSATFQAFGASGAAAIRSMISNSAATMRGGATVLASGMKINAEPKPENPRATLATNATAINASSAKTLTS